MEIKLDENFEIEIIDMGENGEGIGKVDGFTIFVDGGIVGDKVKVKLIKKKKHYGMGKIIKLIDGSNHRVDPKCPHAFVCGGCQVQHMNYDQQLVQKTNHVDACIKRIGKQEGYELAPIIGMESPYHYRNKGQYPVGMSHSKDIQIGFYKTKTHHIVDIDQCFIQDENNNAIIKTLKTALKDLGVSIYEEKRHQGVLRHIMLRNTKAGKWMVVFVTNGPRFEEAKVLTNLLIEKHPEVVSVIQNMNKARGNRVLGYENKILFGAGTIEDSIGDLKFELSPLSFFQVNPIQTDVLYKQALTFAELKGDETVVDVYCGIGTISLFLAQQAKKVVGVEIVDVAIEDAKANAKRNNLNNTEFHTGKAEEVLPKLYEKGLRADVVVVDPPRKGCEQVVLETIANMNPERIVYVSCKPSTLARDLKILSDLGYKTEKVQPVDMFPHTMHIESVCLLKAQ